MSAAGLGPLLHAFFVGHLTGEKGLRRSSVQSYRDAVRLLLVFVADGAVSGVLFGAGQGAHAVRYLQARPEAYGRSEGRAFVCPPDSVLTFFATRQLSISSRPASRST